MEEWRSIDRSIGNFEVILVTGEKLWGSFPIQSEESVFGKNTAGFLAWDKKAGFYDSAKGQNSVSIEAVREFIRPIPFESIKSVRSSETEMGGMSLVGNKPIPNGLQISIENHGKPGFVKLTYQVPGNPKSFEIGELEIKKGEIELRLKLAFVSYAREDQSEVEEITRKLNDHGVLTWFDEKEIFPGDTWESKIETAIEKSDFVLVFFSNKTLNKVGYKNKEIRYILEQASFRPLGSRYIIPVLLDDCQPPREFKSLHWLVHGKKGWLEKLVKVLK